MSPVILIPKFDRALRAAEPTGRKNGRNAKTTADYRRFLSELKLRPPSQRAFLRKLLSRAAATAPKQFPVANHAVHTSQTLPK
ncbi:MAG: hypothetical protein WBR26_21810 [Candidatus Acidiferrum sp.]